MLSAPSLVSGDDVAVAVVLPHVGFQVVEVPAPCIGLVPLHEPGPLVVAHGRGATVRQEVDVDIFAPQEESVVAGLPDERLALLAGGHLYGLDHLDLEGLSPRAASFTWP